MTATFPNAAKRRFVLKKAAFESVRGWSASGRYLAVDNVSAEAETLSVIDVWDTETGSRLYSLEEKPGSIFRSVCWSSDETQIVSLAKGWLETSHSLPESGAVISWWNASDGKKQESTPLNTDRCGCAESIAWSPNGSSLSVRHGLAGGIYIIDGKTGDVRRRIARKEHFHASKWSPDGDEIFAAGAKKVWCFSVGNGRRQWTLKSKQFVLSGLDLSSDGQLLATSEGDRVRVAHSDTGKKPTFLTADSYSLHDESLCQIVSVSFSPDSQFVAGFSPSRGYVWHLPSRERVSTFDAVVGSRGFCKASGLFALATQEAIEVLETSQLESLTST